ncbi:MAG: nitroreductase family protein [Nitrospinota bacterium]|nr:nitroreductase family protein [Nitrospinota bacterium]
MTDKLLSTTRSVRKRLDLEKEVDLDVINECLRLAIQAPTGSNKQGWRWIVVSDEDARKSLADIYRTGNGHYLESGKLNASDGGETQNERVFDSAIYLAENLEKVPVHVIPCIQVKVPLNMKTTLPSALYGSIIPAIWSFQLALRSRGLGSVYTTPHLEKPIKELLKIPKDFIPVALIPVAHTIGKNFKAANRKPLEDVVFMNIWNNS